MSLRELLHYELWSKKTSGKILQRTWRILKPTAVVLGVLFVLAGIAFAVEWNWLTSGERSAGRNALAQIENLERLIDCNCDQFVEADNQANGAIRIAAQKARSLRDRRVVAFLSIYALQIESAQTEDVRDAEVKKFIQQTHLPSHPNPKLEEESRKSRLDLFGTLRTAVQRELN